MRVAEERDEAQNRLSFEDVPRALAATFEVEADAKKTAPPKNGRTSGCPEPAGRSGPASRLSHLCPPTVGASSLVMAAENDRRNVARALRACAFDTGLTSRCPFPDHANSPERTLRPDPRHGQGQ